MNKFLEKKRSASMFSKKTMIAVCIVVVLLNGLFASCASSSKAEITLDKYNSMNYTKYTDVVKLFGCEGELVKAIPNQYNQNVTSWFVYKWIGDDYIVTVKFAANKNKPYMSVDKSITSK